MRSCRGSGGVTTSKRCALRNTYESYGWRPYDDADENPFVWQSSVKRVVDENLTKPPVVRRVPTPDDGLPGDAPRLRPGGSPSCGVRSGLCARFPTKQSSRPDAQPIHSHPSPSTIQTRFGWAFFGAAVAVRFPIQRGFGWASGPDPRLSLAPEMSRRTIPFPARPRPRSRNAV